MGALLDGVYDGNVTIRELLQHGDFGLGTFNHLDGEMVLLDGICYHLHADGTATIADADELTPFATVTWFHADHSFEVHTPTDRSRLTGLIDAAVESHNLIYAIRIKGRFSTVRTRTVMEQHQPYPRLVEATRNQQESVFEDATGTLAGYRTPDYEQGIAVAGYHLHYLDSDRKHGGHALDYQLDDGRVDIGTRSELHLSMPTTPQFLEAHLASDEIDGDIRKSEGG
jgi:acetolactate decarboxylase